MGAVSTLPYLLRVCRTLRFTQIRNHHPYNLALCSSLMRVRRLRVDVKRDPAIRVPQKLLYRLHISPFAFNKVASCDGRYAS